MAPEGLPLKVRLVVVHVSTPLPALAAAAGGVLLTVGDTFTVAEQPLEGLYTNTLYGPGPLAVADWELAPPVMELPAEADQV
jgi:hypothetical protein